MFICIFCHRADAPRATQLICETSRLPETGDVRELVVDRRTLVRANVETARTLMAELAPSAPSGPLAVAAGRARGTALGSALGLLAGRILGQFDPFAPRPTLLLSAPSIMAVERQLKVLPADFRMWVVLHEQTHRVQFANAPWLRAHLIAQVSAIIAAEGESSPLWQELTQRLERVRRDRATQRPASLTMLDAFSSPETAAALDRVTAVMSLLEGHADLMMDLAGRKVITTVGSIRARFNQRRARGGIPGLLNKLVGMDAKLAQYADGAAFCRQVVRRTNLDTLNRAFAAPELLPSMDELLNPERWLTRVGDHGTP